MVSCETARELAEAWIQSKDLAVRLKTGLVAKSKRSWIIQLLAENQEPVFGNAPLIVDKITGVVKPCPDAWREFSSNLKLMERLKRWWWRKWIY